MTDPKPRDALDRPIAPYLSAFLDDSGSDEKSPIHVIAGYCGMGVALGRFHDRWKKALDGPPRFPYWHTNTARNLKYDKRHEIDKPAVERMEIALAEALVQSSGDLCAISVEMRKDDHAEIVPLKLKLTAERLRLDPSAAASISSPYYVLFHLAMIGIHIITSRMGPDMEGQHIFMEDAEGAEWQDQVCHHARAFRRMAKPQYRKAIGAITFAPGKGRVTVPGLEAADLWASHVRRRALHPEETNPVRILLESVRGAQPGKANRHLVTKDELRLFVRAVNSGSTFDPTQVF